MKKAWEL